MHIIDEKNFKILIASENQTYRNNLASKLRIDGFSVEFATSGFHLLHVIEREEFKLIIMHENMFDMSAYEVTSLVRAANNKNELPIIFTSKNKSEESIKEMIFIGANEYVMHTPSYGAITEKAKKYFNLLNAS